VANGWIAAKFAEGGVGAAIVEQPTIVTMNRNSVKKECETGFHSYPTEMAV
jgi:hypothetical protein